MIPDPTANPNYGANATPHSLTLKEYTILQAAVDELDAERLKNEMEQGILQSQHQKRNQEMKKHEQALAQPA